MQSKKSHISRKTLFYRCSGIFLVGLLFTVLLSAFWCGRLPVHAQNASVTQGRRILYQDFIPEAEPYSTHVYSYYSADGLQFVFCIEAHKNAIGSGSYEIRTLSGNNYPLLTKVLAFGYGSPYCKMDEIWPGISTNDPDRAYLYTHIAATYAYMVACEGVSESEYYKGLNTEIAERYGIGDFIRLCAMSSLDLNQSYVNYFQDDAAPANQRVAYIGAVVFSEQEAEIIGKISLKKTGEVLTGFQNGAFIWEEKGLPDTVFELRALEDITDAEGTLLYSGGALVKTMETNRNGIAEADGLYPGKYRIIEKTPATGFVKDVTPHDILISSTHLYETVRISNMRQTIDLAINKKNSDDNSPVGGGVFALYNDEDILNIYGDLIVPSGTLLAKASANTSGIIRFPLDLPFGKYHMEELLAPGDFYLNENPLSFVLSYPANDISVLKVRKDFFNRPIPHFAYLTLSRGEETFLLHQTNYQTGED